MKNNLAIVTWVVLALVNISCHRQDQVSDAYGNFEAEEIFVMPEVQGQVLKMFVDEGVMVDKARLLALVDTTTFYLKKLELLQRISQIKSNRAELVANIRVMEIQKENINRERERLFNLSNEEAAPRQQFEQLDGELKVINAKIEAAKLKLDQIDKQVGVMNIQLAQLDNQLNKCKITSPEKGIVERLFVREGELAFPGKPLLKLIDPDIIYLKVYVSGDMLPSLKINQEVRVFYDKNEKENQEVKGKIAWISSEAEFTPKIIQTKKVRVNQVYAVKIRVENNGFIKSGMPGEVLFE